MFHRTRSVAAARPGAARGVAVTIACMLVVMFGLGGSETASAHTGFESSTPADGESVDEPVSVVTVNFTGEATPVGDEFVALTAGGVVQTPVSIETLDDKVFTLRFEPALSGGPIGIRWNVKAADAHPIEGAFSFVVNATTPTTALTVPQGTVGLEPPSPAASDPRSLEEFLAVDNSTPGETAATVGRLIGLLGVALGLGAFAFVATALRGRRDEVRHVLAAVRILGIVIVVGAVVEYVGVARIGGESLTSNLSTSPGLAAVLRILGGIGLALGIGGTISRGRVQRPMRRPSQARSLSAAVVDDIDSPSTPYDRSSARPHHRDSIVRWIPDVRSWPALAGVSAVIVSFWFDGHTVSKGIRPLHALVNSVHVAAGAVWVGGVATMTVVVWSRYRSQRRTRVVELVIRFSKIATIALASVVAAGAIMAFLVLDSLGELTSTPWGQILMLKTAAVGLAMIGGAYNHFRLVPALEEAPESHELLAELRSTLAAEAILLVFVVSVTAWLVAAAS